MDFDFVARTVYERSTYLRVSAEATPLPELRDKSRLIQSRTHRADVGT